MLKWWKRKVGGAQDGSVPMERWTPERLLEARVYLESKDPSTLTREDHYLVADYLVMRYLPKEDRRTEAEWQRARTALREKIDFNIAHPERAQEPVKDDPDFAEWLKRKLRKKVERGEVLNWLASFDHPENDRGQAQALRMFRFYLERLDHFQIDDDLIARMTAITEGTKL